MSVLGGSAGFTGKVGSLTFVVESPVKFLMAMMSERRSGTSPGNPWLPGASPIIVKMAAISSVGMVPEGRPRIQLRESVMFPKGLSPSGMFERSSK